MTQPPRSRPLGKLEQYSSFRHHLKQYFRVLFAGAYLPVGVDPSSPRNTPFTKADLYGPLAELINEYCSLALTIQNSESPTIPHEFQLLDIMDISKNVLYGPTVPSTQEPDISILKQCAIDIDTLDSNAEMLNLFGKLISTQFDSISKIPPWRVIITPVKSTATGKIIYGTHLTFCYHHALGDGTSGRILLTKTLEILNDRYGSKNTSIVDPQNPLIQISSSAQIPPPLETCLELPESFTKVLGIVLREKKIMPSFKAWLGSPIIDTFTKNAVPYESYRSNIRLFRVPASQMSLLLKKSRQNKTTVTAVFTALSFIALHLALKEFYGSPETPKNLRYPGPKFDGLSCCIPRNLRSNIEQQKSQPSGLRNPIGESFGVFVCSIIPEITTSCLNLVTTTKSKSEAVFAVSAKMKQKIDTDLKNGVKNTDTGLLKFLNDMQRFFTEKVGQPHSDSLEVSSILVGQDPSVQSTAKDGTVIEATAGTADRPYVLRNMTFTQSASQIGSPINNSFISYKGGDLATAITWSSGVMDDKVVEKYESYFLQYIDAVLHE